LIANKLASGRLKDLVDLEALKRLPPDLKPKRRKRT
jgi:hypothetical protein